MRTRMVVINEKQGAVEVDCKIVNLVIEMNNSGFVTFASCQRHEFPVDIIKPYIAFKAPAEIVSIPERHFSESFVPDYLYCDRLYGSSIFSVCKEMRPGMPTGLTPV